MRTLNTVRILAASVLAGLALLAVSCGGSGESGDTTSQPRPSSVPADAPFINQDNLRFKPKELTVKAGETVYFANGETAVHTVNVNGTNESGTMRKGDVFKWTPPTAGSYKITCEFHPQMRATITAE